MPAETESPGCFRIPILRLVVLLCLLAGLAGQGRAEDANARCQRCHGESWIGERRPEALAAMVRAPESGERVLRAEESVKLLHVPGEAFAASAHGKMSCVECHPGIESLPHQQKVTSLSCASCHGEQSGELEKGSHASGTAGGPTCISCHGGPHQVAQAGGERSHAEAIAMVERCAECHSEMGKHNFSPAQSFHDSIHGEALYKKGLVKGPLCIDCHGTHQMLPATNPESRLHPSNVPETCGKCHEGVADVYLTSVHGKNLQAGKMDAATCTSCHHSHGVKEVGPEFLHEVVGECSHCHLELGKSYLLSYHGKATELGRADVAVCSSCHGAHDILPPDDPKSRVAKGNLKETCGKCHPGANDNFVQYIAHVDYTSRKSHPAVFYTFWGMTILLCSVLAVFIPHSLLWFQRTLIGRLKNNHHGGGEKPRMIRRFNTIHRITHGLIIISFMGLVATGFPLKYSYAEWAHSLTAAFGGIYAMGILHRVFAIITFAYAGAHFAYLVYFFWRKCPKPRWRYVIGPDSMLFSFRDFKDFIAMVRWFFRIGPRPRFDRWTYFEKFDYWGEIWGVFLIGGTGLMLWMPTLFTRWLPGWVLNCAMVVHSIEALLAASVIFLVHFFNTHLRPEKFPIDMTMWTGQISEEEMKEERPAEYERLVAANELESRIEDPISLRWRIVGVVLGISAFLFGISLIILAIRTELFNITG